MNNNIIDKVNEGELKGTYKELSKIFEGNENNFNCINSPIVHKIRYIEKKVKDLEIDLKNLKKSEIKRIFKEFIDNNYGNKYNTTIDIVLGALIGEHLRNIEVNKYNSFKKGYFDEIKNSRFYEYAK